MTPFQIFRSLFWGSYKIFKATFLENTSWQPSLYIIWFGVSPKQKYYFESETYLKPSQTSKMKLLAKVVRDAFRRVMELLAKIISDWKLLTFSAKSSILDILMGPENTSGSVYNYFDHKLHLRSLKGLICLCIYLVRQSSRWIKMKLAKYVVKKLKRMAINMSFLRIAVRKIS